MPSEEHGFRLLFELARSGHVAFVKRDRVSREVANYVRASGIDFFRESSISEPMWWATFANEVLPRKIAEGIQKAREDEANKNRTLRGRAERLAKWLSDNIAGTILGMIIAAFIAAAGWYLGMLGVKTP
jgi:hypothetical protein